MKRTRGKKSVDNLKFPEDEEYMKELTDETEVNDWNLWRELSVGHSILKAWILMFFSLVLDLGSAVP